jgi:hypothetical protein
MNRFKSTLCIAVLIMGATSTAFGGTIVGARTSRSGTIVGARGGTIVGARNGNIAGTSTVVRTQSSRYDLTVLLTRNMGVVLRLFMESSLF